MAVLDTKQRFELIIRCGEIAKRVLQMTEQDSPAFVRICPLGDS